MASSADRETMLEMARRIAPQFFAEGHQRVYVASCCGRVLVTPEEVEKCRTCDKRPEGFWVDQDSLRSVIG